MKNIHYTTQLMTASASVSDYMASCVNIDKFKKCCEACPNYGKTWACPPYRFERRDYWDHFSKLMIVADKIIFDADIKKTVPDKNDRLEYGKNVLKIEKIKLLDALYDMEKDHPGSRLLSGGACELCEEGTCQRLSAQPCRHPQQLRYSIESLGGDVIKTCREYFDTEILWSPDGSLPEYFMLVMGLLIK